MVSVNRQFQIKSTTTSTDKKVVHTNAAHIEHCNFFFGKRLDPNENVANPRSPDTLIFGVLTRYTRYLALRDTFYVFKFSIYDTFILLYYYIYYSATRYYSVYH